MSQGPARQGFIVAVVPRVNLAQTRAAGSADWRGPSDVTCFDQIAPPAGEDPSQGAACSHQCTCVGFDVPLRRDDEGDGHDVGRSASQVCGPAPGRSCRTPGRRTRTNARTPRRAPTSTRTAPMNIGVAPTCVPTSRNTKPRPATRPSAIKVVRRDSLRTSAAPQSLRNTCAGIIPWKCYFTLSESVTLKTNDRRGANMNSAICLTRLLDRGSTTSTTSDWLGWMSIATVRLRYHHWPIRTACDPGVILSSRVPLGASLPNLVPSTHTAIEPSRWSPYQRRLLRKINRAFWVGSELLSITPSTGDSLPDGVPRDCSLTKAVRSSLGVTRSRVTASAL